MSSANSKAKSISRVIHSKDLKTIVMEAMLILGSLYMMKRFFANMLGMYPGASEEKKEKDGAKIIAQKLKRGGRIEKIPVTNRYENVIMDDITFPEQIDTTFNDIGGLQKLKEDIYEMVILPLMHPELYTSLNVDGRRSKLLTCPKGVLFYGPPGTGKTMMAKAIAKECDATFINIRLATLQNKWFGESTKLVQAVFSVAKKFQPTIIFIDEIDLLLRERSGTKDHEGTGGIKATFMSLWDGLTTDDSRFLVLGATNRPFDIDKAILRRLPRQFLFGLPDEKEREVIIKVILSNNRLADDFNASIIAERTDGYCGSDLKELCKCGSMMPIREIIKARCGSNMKKMNEFRKNDKIKLKPRPLTTEDCLSALSQVQATGSASYQYQKNFRNCEKQHSTPAGKNNGNAHNDIQRFIDALNKGSKNTK